MTIRDPVAIAWLAGIYEGEGTLGVNSSNGRWVAIIAMCDEDVVRRVQDVAGFGNVHLFDPPSRRRPGWTLSYRWRSSRVPDLVSLFTELRPHLGIRRGARVDEMLQWETDGRPSLITYEAREIHNDNRRRRRAARAAAGLPRGN
jgi:hypothetical protein